LLAIVAQQEGEPEQSAHWLEESLAIPPAEDDPETLNGLARTYFDQKQIECARRCCQRLSELLPHSAQVHLRMGTTLEWLGDWEAAAKSYRRALDLQPNSPDIYGSLARLQCKLGTPADAVESCRRALCFEPHRHELYNLLGYALVNLGDYTAAVEAYRQALLLKPRSAYTVYGLGYLFERKGDLESAEECYKLVLELDPRLVDAHLHIGITHFLRGNFRRAVECFERVRELAPDNTEAQTFLGHVHLLEGKFALGWREHEYRWRTSHFLRGRRKLLQPQWRGEPLEGSRILLHAEQGIVHVLRNHFEKALESFEEARKLSAEPAEARFYIGLVHLTRGNFRLGWSEYEERRRAPHSIRVRRKFAQPVWKGEPLEGSRILLYAEQGFGDTLHFVRYVPLVAARGGRVILEIPPRLHRLLVSFPGAEETICQSEKPPEFDWQCPLLSLPLAFATELNSIPAEIPYIYSDPVLAETWRQRMPKNSLRVGLAWSGSPSHAHDAQRSIPLELLAPLTKVRGTTFYSLQIGPAAQQIRCLGPTVKIVDIQYDQEDFADTAAIIANLDLVISVDTSVAHLAGAMGKAVWVLLDSASDWRWMPERDDSPWYPTARLFRQFARGNWLDVMARVEGELGGLAARIPSAEGTPLKEHRHA
jgi:tetratricopeptide (TPR) repeat protein